MEVGDFARVKPFRMRPEQPSPLNEVRNREGQIGMVCAVNKPLGKKTQRKYRLRFFDTDYDVPMAEWPEDCIEQVTKHECGLHSILRTGADIVLQDKYESLKGFVLYEGTEGTITYVDWENHYLEAIFPFSTSGDHRARLNFTDAFKIYPRISFKRKDFVVINDKNCPTFDGEYGVVLRTNGKDEVFVGMFNKGIFRWFPQDVLRIVPILKVVESIKTYPGQIVRVNEELARMFHVKQAAELFGVRCKIMVDYDRSNSIMVKAIEGPKLNEVYSLPWYVFDYNTPEESMTAEDKYIRAQYALNLEEGDFVRIRKPVRMPEGWNNTWVSSMDAAAGMTGKVLSIDMLKGIKVTTFDDNVGNYRYPYNALVKVSEGVACEEHALQPGTLCACYMENDCGLKYGERVLVHDYNRENGIVTVILPSARSVHFVPWHYLSVINREEELWTPKPGDNVLVRDCAGDKWKKTSLVEVNTKIAAITTIGTFEEFLPYENNACLEGTCNNPVVIPKIGIPTCK